MRILVFSERLRPPLDEGFKNTAIMLVRVLRQQHDVAALTTFGVDIPGEGVRNIPANKLLLGGALRRAVRDAAPDIVVYIPTASATPAAMLRTHVLAGYAPQSRIAMLALQPRAYDPLTRLAIRFIRPHLILTQSLAMTGLLRGLGCTVVHVPPAVDATRFTPASDGRRRALRQQLSLPTESYIVLHVGHINANRNVQVLARVQQAGGQAVLVGSTSTPQDDGLARDLQAAGVIVVRHYVRKIEEYYQAADCYLFPVVSSTGAISVPLSVLEAMACNLPIVTTPYGDLPALFPQDRLRFSRSDDELVVNVLAARQIGNAATRQLVLPFTWQSVAEDIIKSVLMHNDSPFG